MTEITKNLEKNVKPRYSVNAIAFFVAFICAPLVVTALSFWTVVGIFALWFGAIPYLAFGGPALLWAVSRIPPAFGPYAALGFWVNLFMGSLGALLFIADGRSDDLGLIWFLAGFGMIFAPLYAGMFGTLYAKFHPNIRILQT